MEQTDGESSRGDGLPGPASLNNQEKAASAKRNAEGAEGEAAKTKSEARAGDGAKSKTCEGGKSVPVFSVTPEQLAAMQRFLQTLFKSVTAAIVFFLAGTLTTAELFQLFTHKIGGGYKTAPIQNSSRREDRGDTTVENQPVEGEDDGKAASGPSLVPCEAAGVGCLNRVPSGFCQLRQQLCMVAPHPDFFVELQQKLEQALLTFDTAARNQYALAKENAELRQLNQEGYLNFALRVNPNDFLAFAVTMALGNRKAAAEHLKIPLRSFYDRVNLWARGSKDHQRMFRLIEWRKKTGRKILVRLDDSVQTGEPNDETENPVTMAAVLEAIATSDQRDYPAVLRDLFEVLAKQSAKNWESIKGEALQIIKEELGDPATCRVAPGGKQTS